MKALKHIINPIIWSLLAIYLLLLVTVRLHPVQQFLAEKAASALSQKLGTEVSVGSISLGLFNRIIVDDLQIKDQQNSDMLRVGRLSARISLLPLAENRIVITSAQFFGAQGRFYRTDSLAQANFQFVLDSLASRDTTSHTPLDLCVSSLIIRHSSIGYDCLDQPKTPGILNLNHIALSDISTHVQLKVLTDDSLSVNLKRLAVKELSGLTVNRLSFSLEAGRHGAQLRKFYLQLPKSDLTIDSVVATCDADRLKETLRFSGNIADASITPADIVSLVPQLKNFHTLLQIEARFSGTAKSINLNRFLAESADGAIRADINGWMNKVPESPLPDWYAHITELSVASNVFSTLNQEISGFPELLTRLGDVSFTGQAEGMGQGTLSLHGSLDTEIGSVAVNGSYGTIDRQLQAQASTRELALGRLLDNDDIGLLTTQLTLQGKTDNYAANGTIDRLDYKGYSYQHIALDGTYTRNSIAGRLTSQDPNLITTLEGELQQTTPKNIRVKGVVERFCPKSLNISEKWNDAVFSTRIDGNFKATNLNDTQGQLSISDFHISDSAGSYHIDELKMVSGYDEGKHFLKLHGDMGEAELHGNFDWDTLPQSFMGYLASKLPTLPGLEKVKATCTNNFQIDLHLSDTEWLRQLAGIDLELKKPLVVNAVVDDDDRTFNVKGTAPYFIYNGSHYQEGQLDIKTIGDTMRCDVSVAKLSEEQRSTTLQLLATAADNNLSTSLFWDNHYPAEPFNGVMNLVTQLYKNEQGQAEAHVSILPSRSQIGLAEWSIEPSDIIYSDQRLLVDHFAVRHDDQHIIVDGIASPDPNNSIVVDLNGVEVGYVLDLVDFTAVSFGGLATGKAYVRQAFGTPEASAQLTVSQFTFEGGRMGTLNAHAGWNNEQHQIDIHAICDDGPHAKTYIDGYVSPVREDIRLDIRGRGTYIDFLQTYSSSFLSNVTGNAWGDVQLVGPLGEMDLLGQLTVDGRATVTALGTTYTLQQDTVRFVRNDILLDSVPVQDRYQQTAYLKGGIHHDHLSALTFDLDVTTDKFLAYDMPANNKELFYGTVITSGHVDMHGRPGEVVINCTATPLEGTTFTYNAANPDAVANQSFITWKERKEKRDDGTIGHFLTGKAESTSGSEEVASINDASDLFINFQFNAQPDATVRVLMDAHTYDFITLNGNGMLRATYHNKGPFQMFGTYTVDHGTYGLTIQNIIKKNFTFQQGGTITFGGAPMDAALNLQALYTVSGVSLSDLAIGNSFTNNTVRVNCLMNILGQAGSPRVEFDLDMPTVGNEEKQMIRSLITSEQEMNQQVIYLLGIGRFYTQGANNQATQQQYDQTQLAMQSFLSGTMSTQINEVLSQVLKTDNWNFGANISTGNEGWHNAEYEGMISGRMLNNRLLINGQFGYRDNAATATPSFVGDFDIRYLLMPNGNLALKVYNQTNDRYFTRSSLNTQGVGLIIKKDFNGLGDLISIPQFRLRPTRRDD